MRSFRSNTLKMHEDKKSLIIFFSADKRNSIILPVQDGGMENFMKRLLSKWHVNSETGFNYRYIYSETERFVTHCHDYYEIFLTLEGNITHIVNSKTQHLKEGSLVFIRPDDTHIFKYDKKKNYRFINIAFNLKTAVLLFDYIGNNAVRHLLTNAFSPVILLDKKEKDALFSKFENLNMIEYSDKNRLKYQMRILLMEIFTNYFLNDLKTGEDNIPTWLKNLCKIMNKKENFVLGSPRMIELSGKSREHLARCMKKYYNITTSAFINDIRLNYAANMLLSSNMPVIDLCFECGFENISWFYSLFKEKFGKTPRRFRIE